jgi:hypothetical protein
MATAELKVRIDADLKGYQAGLNKAVKETNAAEGQINKAVGGVVKSFTVLNSTKFTFGQNYVTASQTLANQAKKTSETLGGATVQASNRAAFALNNLSRVAQDAPFGFIGIQNNLNPLLESFQALKKETGSTGGALKALGGSLMGAGGLGIALSVVSSAILFAQMGLRAWGVTAEKAAESTEDYAESLNQVTRAQLLGAQSAAQETTTLSLLFKQYQNGELTLEKRKSAYEELQRLYPAYFGNIAFEQEASVKTKNAYDKLTSSIIATARARAAGDLITKNSQRQLENEQKIIDLGIEASKAYQSALKAEEKAKLATASTGESGERIALSLISQSNTERKKATEIQKQINNLVTDSVILRDKNLQLEKSINTEIEKGAVLSGGIGGKAAPKLDPPKFERGALIQEGKTVGVTLSTGIAEGFKEAIPVVSFGLGENLKGGLTEWQSYVNNDLLPKVETNFETFFNGILMRGKISFESLGKAILNTLLSIVASDAARGVTNLLRANTGQEFTDTQGKGKGGGLIGKGIGLLGGLLGGGGGGGKEVATKGLGKILGTALPIAGIALAGASILGGLFKKKQPAQPTPAFTTSNAISTSSSSNVDFGNGRVVFEISGVNLVGVLNRAGAKLQRFGP